MNKLLGKLGKKLAEAADSITNYKPDRPASAAGPQAHDPGNQQHDPCLEVQLRNVRSTRVRTIFFKHPSEDYTEWSDVNILAGSYNVNGKKPPAGAKLGDWIGPLDQGRRDGRGHEQLGAQPDIVAIAFQEVVPLSAGNVIVGSASTNIEAWDRALAAELNGKEWASAQYGPATAALDAGAGPTSIERTGASISAAVNAAVAAAVGAASAASAAATAVATAPNPVVEALERKWSGAGPAAAAAGLEGKTTADRIDALTGGPGNEQLFFQVASKQMVGLYSSVWVRKSLLPHVRGVQTAVVATGFGGWMGNKGAVAVRMYVHDTPLCFVNSHLSSGDKEGDEAKRNANVQEILQRCDFAAAALYDQSMTSASASLLSAALGTRSWGSMRSITDHSNAIWMGDLNYRLAGVGVPRDPAQAAAAEAPRPARAGAVRSDDDVRKLIRAGQLAPLLEADQLLREMAAGRVFQGWIEGRITFPPTFKFKVGTHAYLGDAPSTSAAAAAARGSAAPAPGSSQAAAAGGDDNGVDDDDDDDGGDAAAAAGEKQKKRTPAWCDRILHLSGGLLRQASYGRGEVAASDHKPVSAAFVLHARRYDRRKVEQLLEFCRRQADMLEAAQRPRPSLEPNLVALGSLRYGEARVFSVRLSNAGHAEGLFHFVPPPGAEDEASGLPAWVTAVPEEGTVQPGASCEINLHVCVDGGPGGPAAALARAPNDFLDAIVILRVEDGSDLFLSLTGNYTRSKWLGLPLESIASEPGPGAGLPQALRQLLGFLGSASSLAVPGLLLRSVQEVLGTGAGGGEGAAAPAGPRRATQRALLQRLVPLVDVLEEGREIPADASPHEVACLLLVFLGELPRPLLPAAAVMLVNAAWEAGQTPDPADIPDLLLSDMLSPVELIVTTAVLQLLRKVTASPATCVASVDLASLMGLYLLPALGPHAPPEAGAKRENVLRLLLA